jgi:hypothetical protein
MFKKIGNYAVLTVIIALIAYLVKHYLVFQLALVVLFWLAFFGFEYAINGGSITRCLPEDFRLYGVNGEQKRAIFAKKKLNPDYDSTICGTKRTWHSREEYTEKEYIECGNDILGKGYYFWFSKLIIPFSIALYLIVK